MLYDSIYIMFKMVKPTHGDRAQCWLHLRDVELVCGRWHEEDSGGDHVPACDLSADFTGGFCL